MFILLNAMDNKDIKRLSRLVAILTQLQTKRMLVAAELAEKFNVSIRTIYRDIKALESAGVPVFTEEGKGYILQEGYRIPPVMFTESEANALITAEHLVLKNKDASFVNEYTEAINKIKAVLRTSTKDKANLLSNRIVFRQPADPGRTSNYLATLQLALTNFQLTELHYFSPETNQTTKRMVEPFALFSTQGNWLLVAWCRLRKNYRTFRLDRILQLIIQDDKFEMHQLTLEEYFEHCKHTNSNP